MNDAHRDLDRQAATAEPASDTTGAGTLLSVAPAAVEARRLLRIAIDAEQVGASRIHLAADQPDAAEAVTMIREQTRLVITSDPGGAAEPWADRPGDRFAERVLPASLSGPELLGELARIAADAPDADRAARSVGGAGPVALPVLFGALAVGLHLRVGTADHPPAPGTSAPDLIAPSGPRDDVALVARAAGLARIAGRPALPLPAARAVLGLG